MIVFGERRESPAVGVDVGKEKGPERLEETGDEERRGGVEQAEAVAPKSKLLPLLSAPVPVDPNAPTLRP